MRYLVVIDIDIMLFAVGGSIGFINRLIRIIDCLFYFLPSSNFSLSLHYNIFRRISRIYSSKEINIESFYI